MIVPYISQDYKANTSAAASAILQTGYASSASNLQLVVVLYHFTWQMARASPVSNRPINRPIFLMELLVKVDRHVYIYI